MSAFLVDNDTIDLLVSAIKLYRLKEDGYLRPDTGNEPDHLPGVRPEHYTYDDLGKVLLYQNHRSLGARYGDPVEVPTYHLRLVVSLRPVDIIKSCQCLQYQACETDDYGQTYTKQLLDSLVDAAIRRLPGYEEAPWGWRRPGGGGNDMPHARETVDVIEIQF